ncbi:MAG: hypothetical protein IMY73_04590 [Bacteroidetes bacterium]|nr:hypothetical protein [Bacteroidota bacterium]
MIVIASIITLIPMIISDIRKREVNILWLLLFSVVQLYFNGISNVIYNIGILLFIFLGMYLYIIFRYGLRSKITNYFGMGDMLFLISLTIAFSIREYTYFLIIGFIFSIIWWLISKKETIPLVSTLGSTYIIWLLIKNLYYE